MPRREKKTVVINILSKRYHNKFYDYENNKKAGKTQKI